MKSVFFKHRYVAATIIFAVILFAVIFAVFSIDNSTNIMIVDYARNMGWIINPSPAEISHLTIPNEFDEVYETYNSIQKKSGFNLEDFRGKRVTRYTYQVQNHESSDTQRVYMGVIVYESRIIAADISSTDMEGFLHGICETSKIKTASSAPSATSK